MKLLLAALLLAGCSLERPQPIRIVDGQPWSCEDYLAEGGLIQVGCEYEGGRPGSPDPSRYRKLLCRSFDRIEDDDPALEYFRNKEPTDIENRKVALAIERENSCD